MNAATTRKTRTRQNREESRAKIIAAATELVRDRSYAELSIGEIMDRAGIGRTLFYRHFDDLGALLLQASQEAISEVYDAALRLGSLNEKSAEVIVHEAIKPAVSVFSRHGPILRALNEAAAVDPEVDSAQEAIRQRFDELVAERLSQIPELANDPPANFAETARALNLLNTSYLLDAYGHEPRVPVEVAEETLSEIWLGVIGRPALKEE